MAAFTSVKNGNWNDITVWNAAEYPFQNRATDTYTVAHSVVTTANNPFAGTGTGVVASGGNLICDHDGSAQNWSGALTVQSGGTLSSNNDIDWKNLMVGGSVTLNAGGSFNWRQYSWLILNGDYDFIRNVTTLINGYFIMQGVADGRAGIKGNGTGNECSVLINGYNEMDAAGYKNIIDYADFQYLRPYSANTGSLYIVNLNWSNSQAVRTGNITVSNCTDANYPVYITGSHIKGMTLILDAPARTGTSFISTNGVFTDCIITSSSGAGIAMDMRSACFNCALNGTSVSYHGIYHGAYFDNCILNGVSTSSNGMNLVMGYLRNCQINATSSSNYAFFNSNTATILGAGTTWNLYTTGLYTYYNQYGGTIDGADLYLGATSNPTANSRSIVTRMDYFRSGKIHIDGLPWGLSGGGGANMKWSKWIHDGVKHFLMTNMTGVYPYIADVSYDDRYSPIVFVSDTTNKYFEIIYLSMPGNIDNTDTNTNNNENFTYTGVLNFTGGAYMLLSAGGTLTFPKYKPWSLSKWGKYIFSGSGGNTQGIFFRLWNDGGINQRFYGDLYVADKNYFTTFAITRKAGGYDKAGVSATVTYTGTIPVFMIMLSKSGNPDGAVWIEVYNDDGAGNPTGASIATSNPINCSELESTRRNIWFDFPTPASVVTGTIYHFIVTGNWTPSDANFVLVSRTSTNIEPNAYRSYRLTGGAWGSDTTTDFIFSLPTSNSNGSAYTFLQFSASVGARLDFLTCAGDGKDQIQFYIANGVGSGALQINYTYLRNNIYADINGGMTYVDIADMTYV